MQNQVSETLQVSRRQYSKKTVGIRLENGASFNPVTENGPCDILGRRYDRSLNTVLASWGKWAFLTKGDGPNGYGGAIWT